MNNPCLSCNQEMEKIESDNGICQCCTDIIEFGYPSFPAYRLEDKKQVELLEKKH